MKRDYLKRLGFSWVPSSTSQKQTMSNKECKCDIPNTDLSGKCFKCGGNLIFVNKTPPATTNTQLPTEYNPIGCEHKLRNGLSAWMFQSERSGSGPEMNECVGVCVCRNCGEIRIVGYKWDGKSNHTDRFNEIIHVHHPDAIDAIIKQANYFNEDAKWCRADDYAALQAKGDNLARRARSLRLSVTAHPDYAGEENAEWTDLVESIDEAIAEWKGEKEPAPAVQQGAVWVKASEFKYELNTTYHAKDESSKGAGRFIDDEGGGVLFVWGDGSDTFACNFHKLFILDESAGEKEVDNG
jgi:hypothetical protein